jgi:hypothetical protein
MSVYDWPAAPEAESGDDPSGRIGYNAPRRREIDLGGALRAGRRLAPRSTRRARDRARRAGVAFAPPSGPLNLWMPLGPTATILGGQAASNPRVAGRVRAIAVHPEGERIYAATGNGGIWYSSNGGTSWRSIGGLAATDTPGITRPAHRFACGAILVQFKATEAQDKVFVGTGESTPGTHARPGSDLGGIGILVADGPAASTADDPWIPEAPNLIGHGVYRLAADPNGTGVIAATSIGLLERPASPAEDAPWERVQAAPFGTLESACTDVLWTAAGDGRPERIWVWVQGKQAGLWVGAAGDPAFKPVDTPGAYNSRSALAAANPPAKVYLFNDRYLQTDSPKKLPGLYRVDASGGGKPTATEVTHGVPDVLQEQGHYDIAITVDPANPDRVVIAGSWLQAKPPGATADEFYESYNGSIVVAEIGMKDGNLTYGHNAAPTMLGIGVHADVHDVEFSNGSARLWAACDGGVFRSDHPTKQVGFIARNDGLGIAEANFIASHPTCDGRIVLGLQDNGVIERLSTGVWRISEEGDGGGVAFDATDPTRYFNQYVSARWRDPTGRFRKMLYRGDAPIAAKRNDEDGDASFYSMPAVAKHVRGTGPTLRDVAEVLIGTDRVWYTSDWGSHWFTLPTGTDPITATTYNRTQDQLGESVTTCRWATSDVAWILTQKRFEQPGGQVFRLERTAVPDDHRPGTWNRPPERLLLQSEKNKKDETSAEGPIREAIAWTDLAVNLDANGLQRGPKGAVYLGTAGHPTNEDVDTLWWFDGTETWHPTGLRAEGVPAPVTAVLTDRADPDVVYVGTTVGVWRGTRTLAQGRPPDWVWEALVNGLPEAAVEDLSLFKAGSLKLLRAAIASRGIWEVELDENVVDLTYLRAHDDDLRRRTPASDTKRDGTPGRSWHGSPDVRPRLAPAAIARPALPWTKGSHGAKETLRRFQAALRSQKNDARCRPTGDWDFYFEEVLRDNGAPVAADQTVSITDAFWDSVMVVPHATAEPWAPATTPSEADLYEFTAPLVEGDPDRASCNLSLSQLKVDVVVHQRGPAAIGGSRVRVTLLRWIDPAVPTTANPGRASTWPSGPVPWATAVNEVLNSADGTTGTAFGDGWAFVQTTANRRKTLSGQTLDSARSGVVTFDLDVTIAGPNGLVLLVAVVRGDTAIALSAGSLKDLVLNNSGVAVRSLRANATP